MKDSSNWICGRCDQFEQMRKCKKMGEILRQHHPACPLRGFEYTEKEVLAALVRYAEDRNAEL